MIKSETRTRQSLEAYREGIQSREIRFQELWRYL